MSAKRPCRIWIFSFANALFMLGFTFYWLSLPRTFGDEAFLIKWSSLIKKSLFGNDPKPDPGQVFFVDVSGNKTTIDGPNEFGEISPYHREVITDRRQLSEFFALLNRYERDIPLILCDILFEDSTRHDTRLQEQVDSLQGKILGVSFFGGAHAHIQPVIDMPSAVATYKAAEGMFLKYPLLMGDSLKTVPLVMYEKLQKDSLRTQGLFFYRFDRGRSLPAPIIDFKVRESDFGSNNSLGEQRFAIYDMGTILESRTFMEPEDMRAFFENKLIMIGDFETDIHETPFGELPGPLVIYNTYLTLVQQEHLVSFQWILFLLLSYTLLSYRVFSDVRVSRPRWLVNFFESGWARWVLNGLDEFAILVAITLFSYFLFHKHINILILLIYIKLIEFIWKKMRVPFFKRSSVRQKAVH